MGENTSLLAEETETSHDRPPTVTFISSISTESKFIAYDYVHVCIIVYVYVGYPHLCCPFQGRYLLRRRGLTRV